MSLELKHYCFDSWCQFVDLENFQFSLSIYVAFNRSREWSPLNCFCRKSKLKPFTVFTPFQKRFSDHDLNQSYTN